MVHVGTTENTVPILLATCVLLTLPNKRTTCHNIFVVYLMMLSVTQTNTMSANWVIVNNELERVRKGAVMA
jgi:hypothetical protein